MINEMRWTNVSPSWFRSIVCSFMAPKLNCFWNVSLVFDYVLLYSRKLLNIPTSRNVSTLCSGFSFGTCLKCSWRLSKIILYLLWSFTNICIASLLASMLLSFVGGTTLIGRYFLCEKRFSWAVFKKVSYSI